jgi:hypothetical protein
MDQHPNAARLRAGYDAFTSGDPQTLGVLDDEIVDHCLRPRSRSRRARGGALDAPGVNVVRLRDGKAVEFWSYSTDQYAVDEFRS